ncbi:MAG TPA: hypothetical protein VIX17_21315 [Pyrinomonadaceae bacterium]
MKTQFIGKLSVLITLTLVAASTGVAQKLTAEDVVAKHLESLGTAEARTAVKSRVMQGSVLATVRIGGGGQLKGGAVMASQGPMSLIGLIFGTQDYGNEKMAFDGNKLTLGELRPGTRTRFGGFLLTHDILFKEGLIGGTLSSAWPLLDLENRKPKLRYAGTKKLDGRQTHVLEYEPRTGGNLDIKMYFDAETFQHVRTEYQQEFHAPTVDRPEIAAAQQGTRLKFTEDFSDYRKEGGLTLPHTYKMQLTFESERNPLLQDWVVSLNQFLFNKQLDVKQFVATGG